MSGCDPPESQYTLFYKSEETNLSAFTENIRYPMNMAKSY